MQYYRLPLERLFVVVDDVYLTTGRIKIAQTGGAGGHNGLKNMKSLLRTHNYPRMRLGVGKSNTIPMKSHVLGTFPTHEHELLRNMIQRSILALEKWIAQENESLLLVMNEFNVWPTNS